LRGPLSDEVTLLDETFVEEDHAPGDLVARRLSCILLADTEVVAKEL
jgi:hypothetical protein